MTKTSNKNWIAFGTIFSISLVTIIGLVSYFSLQKLRDDQKWVEHTIEVIDKTNFLIKTVVDSEASLRGYLLTGDKDFIDRYEVSRPKIDSLTKNLILIVSDNSIQINEVYELKKLIDDRLKVFNQLIVFRNSSDFRIDAKKIELLKLGKQKMDKVRAKVDEIINRENSFLAKRRLKSDVSNQRTKNIIFFGTILIILIVFILFSFIKRIIKNQINAQNQLTETNLGLQKLFAENQETTWQITGSKIMDDAMRGTTDIETRTNNLIIEISKYIGADMGVMYLLDEDNNEMLHRIASYAYAGSNNLKFSINDGLIGQVAKEKNRKIWDNLPNDYVKVTSGLGSVLPRYLLIEPLFFQNELKAVIELAFVNPIEPRVFILLDRINAKIGIGINSLQDRIKMRALIEETQIQAEELQSQQEELRTINEELITKTQMLQSSEEELRVQQEELKEINVELEIKARTLEEKNKVIDEAREAVFVKMEELQLSGKYKSEFLANMSHELRTPLNSILILARILKDNKNKNLSDDETKYANVIYKAGNDLLLLINDILDLAKIEAGKFDFNFENVAIREVRDDLFQLFNEVAINKKVNFNIEVDAKLPQKIEIDKLRVEQILRNLLSNAFKFTPKEGTVNLVFKPEADFIRIDVTDTGIGIPEDKQKVIFEAFQQADGSTNRKFGGTGLGLSISKELSQRMNGKILVESKEGEGSVFSLIIPTKPEVKQTIISENAVKKVVTKIDESVFNLDNINATTIRNKPLVMIVEDDVFLNNFLKGYVSKKGFDSLQIFDGENAVEEAIKQIPDAILLDIVLPGIDGWEVLKKLKSEAKTQSIPVHMMSGGEQKEQNAIQAGALSFIKKPLEKDVLDKIFNDLVPPADLKYKSILLIEDKQIESEVIAKLFKNRNINVKQAYTGQQGLEFLEQENFDCLILDLNLPDINGYELLERIKIDSRFKDLPVIINTSLDLNEGDMNKLRSHANATIVKSAKSSDRLIDEVNLFLHKFKSEDTNYYTQAQNQNVNATTNKTILLVDDDMRNIFALSAILDNKGYKVEIANNGVEALNKIKKDKAIDLVLMDVMMPVMDGLEAMRQIRANPETEKLPIIALTAKAMKEDRDKCIASGANDYVTKPIDIDKLLALVKIWIA